MTIPEILKELTPYTGHFPLRAMTAAVEQRDAITPELLRVLEDVARDPVGFAQKREHSMLHLFGMYLLAQFRESRAYRPLVAMFSAPGETAFELAGDTVTERLKSIFGSVYDGDPGPLQRLVEDENVNEYVRSAALDVFIVLVESGQMPREEVASYYRDLFEGRLKRTFSYAWTGLVTAVADLPAPELLEPVRQAIADGLVDGGFRDLEWIERTLQHPERRNRVQYRIITDAIAEMEWWAAFDKDKRPCKLRQPPAAGLAGPLPQPPPSRPQPPPQPPMRVVKTGRNDPCPCGSGKKYKKCCGRH